MTGDGKVYVAPVDGGEWTEIGYVTGFDIGEPAAEAVIPAWTSRSLEVTRLPAEAPQPALRLDPGDGRDQPRLPDVSNLKLPPQPGEKIAAVTPESYIFSGVYRRCDTCRAPAVDPFPAGWRLDLFVDGGRVWMTPHRDTCTVETAGAAPVRAEHVHSLSLDLDAWAGGGCA